jgi:hypothetical protein
VAALSAWAGLVLGHVAAYALSYPSDSVRHTHLLLTGHGWVGPALLSLAAAIPAALAGAAVRSARSGPMSALPTAARLTAVQVPAFLFVEAVERHGVVAALADPAVLTGLVVQVLVAVTLGILLGAFTRAVAVIAGRRSRLEARARPVSDRPPSLEVRAQTSARPAPVGRRAPPIAVVR